MPTYEYKCIECSDVFETIHGMNETVEACPKCGGRVRRLFHPVGIIFKGSGFYKTDSRSASDNGKEGFSPEKMEKELERVGESKVGDKKAESTGKEDL